MGDHDIIVNDVLPQPEVGSAGNPEEVVCENDIVTSGDDVFLEEIVFPVALLTFLVKTTEANSGLSFIPVRKSTSRF